MLACSRKQHCEHNTPSGPKSKCESPHGKCCGVQPGEIYLVFTEPLEALGLEYVVTGSVASSSYGDPRFTHDIDLILSIHRDAIDGLWRAFPIERFYCPPLESLRAEVDRKEGGHFNLVHHESGFKADVYVASQDELEAWALKHARVIEIMPGRSIRLAPPEYVMLRKLQFYLEGGGDRHIRDIRAMLELSGDAIDAQFLADWVARLGVGEAWAVVKGE